MELLRVNSEKMSLEMIDFEQNLMKNFLYQKEEKFFLLEVLKVELFCEQNKQLVAEI